MITSVEYLRPDGIPHHPHGEALICLRKGRRCGDSPVGKALTSYGGLMALLWLLGVDDAPVSGRPR